ncbi:MAG: histone deacetylase family protein [Geminicoccaceae bacterium]
MKTIYSKKHRLRNSKTELYGGELILPFERPDRAEFIIERVRVRGLGAVLEPDGFGLEPVLRIHTPDFTEFLRTAWTDWKAAGFNGEAIPTAWPARRMRTRCPVNIDGRLGYYALASETSISEGTWEAALASKDVALTGAAVLRDGDRAAFSLCRPPGHHATVDMYGGYCFFNNAAIAAQSLLDHGASRVAILDVDFHHGNGTQDIFYDRSDVLFVSLHGRPEDAFPYFLGYADETGNGAGEGFNLNYPLRPGSAFGDWRLALDDGLRYIGDFAPDALVVSLGVDTFEKDPISFFRLSSEDFLRYGERIAGAGLPTLFVMEGGYAIEEVGINTVNVLEGFEQAG